MFLLIYSFIINPLDSKGNYSATSNNTKLVHWPLMGGLLHLVYSEEGIGRSVAPPSPHLAVPNVTAHPSTASVPSLYCYYVIVRCSAVLMKRLIIIKRLSTINFLSLKVMPKMQLSRPRPRPGHSRPTRASRQSQASTTTSLNFSGALMCYSATGGAVRPLSQAVPCQDKNSHHAVFTSGQPRNYSFRDQVLYSSSHGNTPCEGFKR